MQSTHARPYDDRVRVARTHGVNVVPSVPAPRANPEHHEPTHLEFPNVASAAARTR
jgi:hypothetical protein